MKCLAIVGILFAVCLRDVLGTCSDNSCGSPSSCRTNCPNPSPTADLIDLLICEPQYAVFDYGGGVYPVTRFEYSYVRGGDNAFFKILDNVAYIIQFNNTFYYFDADRDNCPKLELLSSLQGKIIPKTTVTEAIFLDIYKAFGNQYPASCDIFVTATPDETRAFSADETGDLPKTAVYFNTLPSAMTYSYYDKNYNNVEYSQTQRVIDENHLNLQVTSTKKDGNYIVATVQYGPTTYGEPKYCPRDSSFPSVETIIAKSGCDGSCINSMNSNAVCLLSQCTARVFAQPWINSVTTWSFDSIKLALVVSPNCKTGISFIILAGPAGSDISFVVYKDFFRQCY